MWQYFWKFQTDIPAENYVITFGSVHLTWVAVSLLFIFILAYIYKKSSIGIRRRIEISIALILAFSYILRWIWVIAIGRFSAIDMLPLHLCALSAGMNIIAVFSRKPLFKEFGYALGLPGGLVTFLMPGEPYPFFHFYYLLFVSSHFILILLPIIWVWGDGFRPHTGRLWKCAIILLVMAGVDVIINILIGSNYMFLNYAPPDTPLTAAAKWAGNPGYQFYMALIVLGTWILLYSPWIILQWKRRKPALLLKSPD